MIFQIKSHLDGSVLFELETESFRLCVEAAVKVRADLRGADLRRANGFNRHLTDTLLMLREQPGAIRAYKLVTSAGVGPFNGGITYEAGQSYEVAGANTDEAEHCAAGISLATLPWCLANWGAGNKILIAEFTAADIAAIPVGTDGKFRVHRCVIVRELDLASIGWPPKAPEQTA